MSPEPGMIPISAGSGTMKAEFTRPDFELGYVLGQIRLGWKKNSDEFLSMNN